MIRLGNNKILKTLKTLTFVDADSNGNANANAEGSTIALRERCSGELIIKTEFASYGIRTRDLLIQSQESKQLRHMDASCLSYCISAL